MTNTEHQNSAFMLGEVEVRPDTLELVVSGEVKRVEPRLMDVLVYGSERAGQVLSGEQILQDVWGDTHKVPEALQRVISLLRKSLDDSREAPVFIETISKKGYRFLMTPKAVSGQPHTEGEEDINLTEKSVSVSPLHIILVVVLMAALAWVALRDDGNDVPLAPQPDGSEVSSEPSDAPVPEAQDD